ncbi:MAG: hypothetical protein IT379_40265 [Deltaproteobacteria bacterium]|nr:hypothetical protein [Deltaproteobacteria bacterium]
MGFVLRHRWGGTERDPALAKIDDLLAELDKPDDDHPDVSLTHESGWCLAAFPSGLVVYENLDDEDARPRHMRAVSRDRVAALMRALAGGDLERLEAEPWYDGYGR